MTEQSVHNMLKALYPGSEVKCLDDMTWVSGPDEVYIPVVQPVLAISTSWERIPEWGSNDHPCIDRVRLYRVEYCFPGLVPFRVTVGYGKKSNTVVWKDLKTLA